jgi:hypothetical protein
MMHDREREAQSLPKIGPWTDKLDQLLPANEVKVAREGASPSGTGPPLRHHRDRQCQFALQESS